MLKEIIESYKTGYEKTLKYLPKKLQKEVTKALSQLDWQIEAYEYPEKAHWFGFYGNRHDDRLLEFNVKAYFDVEPSVLVEEGYFPDENAVYAAIDAYYEMGREDFAEDLKYEFGVEVEGYSGRSGGYILLNEWDEYIYEGTGYNIYADPGEVYEVKEAITAVLDELEETGPLAEDWEEAVGELQEWIPDVERLDIKIKKDPIPAMKKKYIKLEKYIKDYVSQFEKNAEEWLKDFGSNNYGG